MVALSANRRKKTKWVLQLRILFFIGVPAAYLLIFTSSAPVQQEWPHSRQYLLYPNSRKLLSSQTILSPESASLFNQNQEKIIPEFVVDQSAFIRLDPSSSSSSGPSLLSPPPSTLAALDNCTPAAILDFPADGLTRTQRRSGWILIHGLIACYCFWLIAIVCDDYFVPVIDSLCEKMQMKKDIAGATFMAVASSSSELFINCVATFITEGDIGVGTIVGSAVFNILAVPACCGLIAGQVILLDRWPVTRDCFMYGFAVIALILTLLDGKIMWYESLCLVLAYALYITAISYNDKIAHKIRTFANRCKKGSLVEAGEITPLLSGSTAMLAPTQQKKLDQPGLDESKLISPSSTTYSTATTAEIDSLGGATEVPDMEFAISPWQLDGESCLLAQVLRWPIVFLLWATIPDCRRTPSLRFLTFFVCIAWIGLMSYVVAYMITIIGDTMNIPDSVMGLTFLAAGTSIPEAVSSVIVTNQGHGTMGISNSIGSNTFDILLCLGLPWFIKSAFFPTTPGNHFIALKSSGMAYSAASLLTTLAGLYCAFVLNKFKLDWKVGLICSGMYGLFLIFASMMELNVFFPVNLPTCDHD